MFNPFAKSNVSNDLQAEPTSPESPGLADLGLELPTIAPKASPARQKNRKIGRPRIEYPAIQKPTDLDIAFTAGFYEGEGHVTSKFGKFLVSIGQNDREKLDWIQVRFGGRVYGPVIIASGNDHYYLIMVREIALDFMFSIFGYLSESRKKQYKGALLGEPQRRKYQRMISDEGISLIHVTKALNKLSVKKEKEAIIEQQKHPIWRMRNRK